MLLKSTLLTKKRKSNTISTKNKLNTIYRVIYAFFRSFSFSRSSFAPAAGNNGQGDDADDRRSGRVLRVQEERQVQNEFRGEKQRFKLRENTQRQRRKAKLAGRGFLVNFLSPMFCCFEVKKYFKSCL